MELLGTGHQRAGKSSRISINGGAQLLCLASWDVTIGTSDLPTVNFESFVEDPQGFTDGESYDEGLHGPVKTDIRAGGLWDAGTNFLVDPPGLFPRDDLANVQFYISRATLDDTFFDFEYQRIRSANCKTDVGGTVAFDYSGMNQGQFSMPTGDN